MTPDGCHDRSTLLLRCEPFAHLDARELSAVAAATRLLRIPARRALCHKGEPSTSLFIIASGRFKLISTSSRGDELLFSILGPGDLCDETCVSGDGARSATVVALEDSEVLVLDRRDLLACLRRSPELAIELLDVLARRVRQLEQRVEDGRFLSSSTRIAKALLALAERYGEPVDGGLQIGLPLSQTELGELVATSRESVNKQLRSWTREGIVSVQRGAITIRDPSALSELASSAA